VKDAKSGEWTQCGKVTSESESKCQTQDPSKEFVERDCGGIIATAVRLFSEKQGAQYMVSMELEAYAC
jgi:hypothetical protein